MGNDLYASILWKKQKRLNTRLKIDGEKIVVTSFFSKFDHRIINKLVAFCGRDWVYTSIGKLIDHIIKRIFFVSDLKNISIWEPEISKITFEHPMLFSDSL